MNWQRVLFALLIAAVSCGCALAHSVGATLQRTVTDSTNAAVPNVTVDLKNVATGAVRTTESTDNVAYCAMAERRLLRKTIEKAGSL